MTPSHQCSDRELLEDIRDRVAKIEERGFRRDADSAILRARVKRVELDHGELSKTVSGHSKKINYFVGAATALTFIGTILGWFADKLFELWRSAGSKHS